MIIDADFEHALEDLRNSSVVNDFNWLTKGLPHVSTGRGWSVSIKNVIDDEYLTLDPKRHSRKLDELRSQIKSNKYVELGHIVDILPQLTNSKGQPIAAVDHKNYRYVELQDIGYGEYRGVENRGWQLPSRARHLAEQGDIYVGSIWGSVQKWCLIGPETEEYVVTNGCHRLRIKAGKEKYLLDLIIAFCTEAYATQMRAFSRGSDGLAEVSEEDLKKVLIPVNLDRKIRKQYKPFLNNLQNGKQSLKAAVEYSLSTGGLNTPQPPERPNHTVLV